MTPAPTEPTTLAPTAAQLWLRWRGLLAGTLVLLLGGLLYAGLSSDATYPPLDPRSTAPDGTHALNRLLEQQGVAVDTPTGPGSTIDDGRPVTVLLPVAHTLTIRQLHELRHTVHTDGGRLVLVAPDEAELSALAPGTHLAGPDEDDPPAVRSTSTHPGCDLPEARRAGSAELGGIRYAPAPQAQGCYTRLGMPTLVRTPEGAGDIVVLGSERFLSNDRLDDDGNAALALGLLGAHQRLVWYLPDYDRAAATGGGDRTLADLLPAGWRWGLLQAAVAALLAAVWRARRLGPLVPENLPVVVRAAETTEGRARLYQRAKARSRAADALRRATRARLAAALSLPAHPDPDPVALTTGVAARVPGGRAHDEVQALLYGAAPADDAALLRLADQLDTLERQVRQP